MFLFIEFRQLGCEVIISTSKSHALVTGTVLTYSVHTSVTKNVDNVYKSLVIVLSIILAVAKSEALHLFNNAIIFSITLLRILIVFCTMTSVADITTGIIATELAYFWFFITKFLYFYFSISIVFSMLVVLGTTINYLYYCFSKSVSITSLFPLPKFNYN